MAEEVKQKKKHNYKVDWGKAFEYYYSLGSERSLAEVAKKFGISEQMVARKSARLDWQNKIKKRDEEINKKLERKAINTIADVKAKQLNIVRYVYSNMLKRLEAGEDMPLTTHGLVELLKHELLLFGVETEKIKIEGEVNFDIPQDKYEAILEILAKENSNDDQN